jgi:hypothetical protein
MAAVFAGADPETYRPHALHDAERMWPETNCYVDLWIEVLNAFGSRAGGDARLLADAGLRERPVHLLQGAAGRPRKRSTASAATELAIFDRVESHVATQIARGRLCLVEMDSFYMPDTRGVAYGQEHGKTTVAINRLDLQAKRLDYFHNAGFFRLEGADFDGLFHLNDGPDDLPFLPYTEFAKFPEKRPDETHLRREAKRLAAVHFARRPAENPVAAFAKAFPGQVEAVADRPFGFFHKYAFNTLRQLGANFELAGSHLDWLAPDGSLNEAAEAARKISETAKSVQFQLARAVTRRKFDPLATALDPAIEAWDSLMAQLATRID